MTPLAVLVSLTGSILEEMLKDSLRVGLVIADRACLGLEIAKAFSIPAELIERTNFTKTFDRDAYTRRVLDVLLRYDVQFVAMAGFMTVFSQPIFDHYANRIFNTHPSLLPSFKGNRPVRDALQHGVKITGCTIHIATPDPDGGPILAQQEVPILPGDTETILHERIKKAERVLYPRVLREQLQLAKQTN